MNELKRIAHVTPALLFAVMVFSLYSADFKNERLIQPTGRYGSTVVAQADHVVPPRLVPCDPEFPLRDDVLAGCLWGREEGL